MKNITLSLRDLLGDGYCDSAKAAAAFLRGDAAELFDCKVEFWPEAHSQNIARLLQYVGKKITDSFDNDNNGAPTDAFAKAAQNTLAPISAFGPYRAAENGSLYYISKSEHYHTPLGHAFPGYELLSLASRAGATNATHNNTRGYITRLCEKNLIAAANGIAQNGDIRELLKSKEKHVLNRVVNLETGSLATEAAVKMMLARFYRLDTAHENPVYKNRIPVFLVMADKAGGTSANYHGTTLFTQKMRGMWPDMSQNEQESGSYKIIAVPPDDIEAFSEIHSRYNAAPYKTAGFIHEIVMMNYGGIRLSPEFLRAAYEICDAGDTPVLCDEIQSCMWCEGMFLFRLYGLRPDFVAVGKGFPGGQYPASRIICTAPLDNLNQFGALVTNGQEELASLAYLITMRFAAENAAEIAHNGAYYRKCADELVQTHKNTLDYADGFGHMTALAFKSVDAAVDFCKKVNAAGFDISAQTYKPECPPVALTKLPLTAEKNEIDALIKAMDGALRI